MIHFSEPGRRREPLPGQASRCRVPIVCSRFGRWVRCPTYDEYRSRRMSTTDCATAIAPPDLQSEDSQIETPNPSPAGASKTLKGLLIGFTATVAIGLALGTWYLSVRIVAAGAAAAPSVVTGRSVSSAPAPPPAPPQVTVPPPAAPADLYLHVAGLGPQQDVDFVRSLHAQGFRAQVQTADTDDARILIGPYSSQAEMEQAQHKLQSAGVLSAETAY